MITNVLLHNFKKLERISFPLAESVAIIGPNNSGKSTIFQALCLWEIGVINFISAKKQGKLSENGTVILNRKDLANVPIEEVRFLWTNTKTTAKNADGSSEDIVLFIELEGENNGKTWKCKADFYYENAESFSCKITSGLDDIMDLYDNDAGIRFGFLQPMSGIASSEDKLTQGSIDRKLGEGKTAEIIRNICYEILYPELAVHHGASAQEKWESLCGIVKELFGVALQKPEYIKATGLIHLEYIENGVKYDISSGGRGFLQTLLLFAYMLAKPRVVFLLDEPDAHLEVIRQREIFQRINRFANEHNAQAIIASHSEVLLDEAAEASKVIALIENRIIELNKISAKNIRKSLTEIGWEKYYLARSKGHVLYLEGSSDLQMLLYFAHKLQHKAESFLRVANVDYTGDNVPNTAVRKFVPLQEVFPQLKGLALFDNLPNLTPNPKLNIICWRRRELENYFARPDLLLSFAQSLAEKFPNYTEEALRELMAQTIQNYTTPAYLKDLEHDWWNTAKLSDDWLDAVFADFYKTINVPQDFYKRDYYRLVSLMKKEDVPKEIAEKLDIIYELIKS